MRTDRRLYVTADRSEVVEEGDVRGAWLLAAAGRQIGDGDIQRYEMREVGGRITYRGGPLLEEQAPEEPSVPEPEAHAEPEPTKAPSRKRGRSGGS